MDKKESINLNTYFPALDGIRFLAVFMVMFSHWVIYSQLKEINSVLGATGVNIFFTLSGFLISRILLVQKVQYQQKGLALFRSFYARRALRIFPLYYLVLLIGLIIAIPGARESFLRLAFFVVNIPGNNWITPPVGIYNHFWSLATEEQFYIFLPFLLMVIPSKFLQHFFWGLIAVGLLSRLYIYSTDLSFYHKRWVVYTVTPCCFDSFGLGGILAWYLCFRPSALEKIFRGHWFAIISLLLFLGAGSLKMKEAENPVANMLLRFSGSFWACWMIGGIVCKKIPGWLNRFFLHPLVVYLGKISFGLYVIHPFVSWGIGRLRLYYPDFPFSIMVYAIIYALLTILLASLSWKYFEKPLNALKRRFPYKGEEKN
ncbi:MAG TPA: acyltransferase [Chitinophagaceae bacterium]|jgi:peptidoglycan/LPS O-acetylase OafA/YrhL|nr:acyltransferase [Chitinophagaceae bacterium]